MALVSLTRALHHLRFTDSVDDGSEYLELPELDEIMAKIEDASAVVLRHVKDPENTAYWDEDTTPGDVQAAVLIQLTDLWEQRGSDNASSGISPAVVNLLRAYRDPTLA